MHNNLGALGTWHCSRSKKMDPLRLRPRRPPQHIRPTTHPPPKAPVAHQNAHQQRTPNTTRAVCTSLTHMSTAAPVLTTTPTDNDGVCGVAKRARNLALLAIQEKTDPLRLRPRRPPQHIHQKRLWHIKVHIRSAHLDRTPKRTPNRTSNRTSQPHMTALKAAHQRKQPI